MDSVEHNNISLMNMGSHSTFHTVVNSIETWWPCELVSWGQYCALQFRILKFCDYVVECRVGFLGLAVELAFNYTEYWKSPNISHVVNGIWAPQPWRACALFLIPWSIQSLGSWWLLIWSRHSPPLMEVDVHYRIHQLLSVGLRTEPDDSISSRPCLLSFVLKLWSMRSHFFFSSFPIKLCVYVSSLLWATF
jgi:hypothetical protein